MSISAKELAAKLNMSAATVSMVLNNKPGISEETKKLVLAAASEYGLKLKKNDTPGIIQFILYKQNGTIVKDTPFFSQVIEGVSKACKENNYNLQITYFYANDSQENQIKTIKQVNSQGIIILGTEMTKDSFAPFSQLGKPIVILDTYFGDLDYDFVLINNVEAAFQATNYLASLGAKKIGYLCSNYRIGNFIERKDGFKKALAFNKLEYDNNLTIKLTPSIEGAYRDMLEYIKKNQHFADAYFADNDLIAAGVIKALKEKGYKLPEEIKIIGFDDMPICELIEPTLSTMSIQKEFLGTYGLNILIDRINNKNYPKIKTEIAAKKIIRNSTGS